MLGIPKRNKVHFVGVGGIGMSGIAEVLLDLGHRVSGSDIAESAITERLRSKGAEIHLGHREANVDGASLVVYSTAIDANNPEIKRARSARLPLVRRAEMLAELMRLKYGIAIAGSHGKTTTTSMVATIFHEAGKDPTHIIGGVVNNLGGNAQKGDGDVLVAEADESDGSFLHLNPIMAVITNVDNDHLDYHGSEENLRRAFADFANKVPFYGRVVLNAQDAWTQKILTELKRPYVRVGLARGLEDRMSLDYAAEKPEYRPGRTEFDLWHQGQRVGRVVTQVSGEHNVLNALAAVAVSHEAGLGFPEILAGIAKFGGVGRRLESLWKEGDFEVIDDYGHHPTEIRATLATLKQVYRKPICVVFEPHRYSRTQHLWKDFTECFRDADEVYVGPIYAASEAAIPGITGERLAEDIHARNGHTQFMPNLDGIKELIASRRSREMVLLTLGAGSISKKAKAIVREL